MSSWWLGSARDDPPSQYDEEIKELKRKIQRLKDAIGAQEPHVTGNPNVHVASQGDWMAEKLADLEKALETAILVKKNAYMSGTGADHDYLNQRINAQITMGSAFVDWCA